MSTAKPILKWAGGKQGLAATLVDYFPEDFGVYFEPFIGGASVFLTLQPERAVLGDLNDWLLDVYAAVRSDWRRVAASLDTLRNTKTEYLRVRSVAPESLDLHQRAAHLIFLNKTCFRGLFRVNRRGQFNVPYGAYRRRYYDPTNLERMAARLRAAEIRRGDFELCLRDVAPTDFVYFDPPYDKLGGYSDFNRYTPGKFRQKDHVRLAAVCRELDKRGVRWVVSNSDTSFIKYLYSGYEVRSLASRREINLNSADRDVHELVIRNF
jgi:DNA adenine methylase